MRDRHLRLIVERTFSTPERDGTLITGRLVGGVLAPGMVLRTGPDDLPVQVTVVEVDQVTERDGYADVGLLAHAPPSYLIPPNTVLCYDRPSVQPAVISAVFFAIATVAWSLGAVARFGEHDRRWGTIDACIAVVMAAFVVGTVVWVRRLTRPPHVSRPRGPDER